MKLKSLKDQFFRDREFRKAYAAEDLIHRVAERIQHFRNNQGLTQEELAQRLGTKQPRVARIEGGFENLTLRTLSNLAFELECRAEDLVSRRLLGDYSENWSKVQPKASFEWETITRPELAYYDCFTEAA